MTCNHRTTKSKLIADGWVVRHGGRHDIYSQPDGPGCIVVVPRHRTLSKGVARKIAKKAGWR